MPAVGCRLWTFLDRPARAMTDPSLMIARGRRVLATEAAAVAALEHRLDDSFARACDVILACTGKAVVTGMGKSGHVGSKIAATLASTGTPAFFLHPGEAIHGDIGMITAADVVLALSNSGETDELLTILPVTKRLDVPLIALTGNGGSTLARYATAEEIAALAVFLLGRETSYMHGSILWADGGSDALLRPDII